MKYKVDFLELPNNDLKIVLPSEIAPIEILLMADIQNDDASPWLKLIANVMDGISDYEEATGNTCSLEINRETTKVIDNFAPEDRFKECTIETKELRSIIELWAQKKKEN